MSAEEVHVARDARGLLAIGLCTVAVFGWLWSQRAEDAAGSASERTARADDALPEFVEIPAGPFEMGSDPRVDPRAYDNERWSAANVQGTVELPAFYIGRFEVTVAQFRAFVEATGYSVDAGALARPGNHPVGNVSWPDALAYCRWLENVLRRSPQWSAALDDGFHVTLPTEAQWEKAAKGGDGRVFPWGGEPGDGRANYKSSGTTPVGNFACPECSYGLSDMSGNVWELTRSPYRPYPFDPTYDDVDLAADALWVMRGGSYGDGDQNIRTTIRGGADPGARRPFIGFRIVLTRD